MSAVYYYPDHPDVPIQVGDKVSYQNTIDYVDDDQHHTETVRLHGEIVVALDGPEPAVVIRGGGVTVAVALTAGIKPEFPITPPKQYTIELAPEHQDLFESVIWNRNNPQHIDPNFVTKIEAAKDLALGLVVRAVEEAAKAKTEQT